MPWVVIDVSFTVTVATPTGLSLRDCASTPKALRPVVCTLLRLAVVLALNCVPTCSATAYSPTPNSPEEVIRTSLSVELPPSSDQAPMAERPVVLTTVALAINVPPGLRAPRPWAKDDCLTWLPLVVMVPPLRVTTPLRSAIAPMALSSPLVTIVTLFAVTEAGAAVALKAVSAAEFTPVVVIRVSLTEMLAPSRAVTPTATLGVVVVTVLLVNVRDEPTPSTCTAGAKGPVPPLSRTLLLLICAEPPALMETPNARDPPTWIAVSATWACEPAPSTERPKPRRFVVVIALPL